MIITALTFSLNAQNALNNSFTGEVNVVEDSIIKAQLQFERSEYYDALITLQAALELAEKSEDKDNEGLLHIKIGELQYLTGDFENAISSLIKSAEINRVLHNDINLAVTYNLNGEIYADKGDYKTALDYFTSAKALFEQENLEKLVGEVLYNQSKIHITQNNYTKAGTLLEKAVIIAKKYKSDELHSKTLIKSALTALKTGNINKAFAQAKEGNSLASVNKLNKTLRESYWVLSEVYMQKGDYKNSNANLKLFISLNESLNKLREEKLSPDKEAQLLLSTKDRINTEMQQELVEEKEANDLTKLTTILSIGLITILSLLTLSLYKNNNIRLKTNNMLHKKNDELLTEKERAEIAAHTKSQFLSTVTHELRTPLYAVTGITNMLLDENPKDDQIQHLKSLKFSGDYLLTFINDILQINKIEANKVELDPELFNLKLKVENVISALSNSALDNNTQIHCEFDDALPQVYNADQLKISQILINLIGNSIKFTKDGDIWVRVKKLSQSGDNYSIRFEVEDNGIGISKEKQESLFESFNQGSVQINRKYGGTGLGLSIVKGLIGILNGQIYMKSELNKGTNFYFEIPMQYSSEVIEVEKEDFSEKTKDLDLSELEILVVEDNKINQMITKKILNKMGLTCQVVDNGEVAVEKVKEENFAVVLMDIHMPGISGIEATKRIRAFDKNQTIFALTAVTLEDKMQEFEEAGFDDIISKPFKQEDFEKKLYLALTKSKQQVSA
jgi:signal transduction histidine kinase/CheY-like chemotaxis protein